MSRWSITPPLPLHFSCYWIPISINWGSVPLLQFSDRTETALKIPDMVHRVMLLHQIFDDLQTTLTVINDNRSSSYPRTIRVANSCCSGLLVTTAFFRWATYREFSGMWLNVLQANGTVQFTLEETQRMRQSAQCWFISPREDAHNPAENDAILKLYAATLRLYYYPIHVAG